MFEQIKSRYEKSYVTDEQLGRYVALKVITQEQAEQIKTGAAPKGTIATADLDTAYQEGVNSYV